MSTCYELVFTKQTIESKSTSFPLPPSTVVAVVTPLDSPPLSTTVHTILFNGKVLEMSVPLVVPVRPYLSAIPVIVKSLAELGMPALASAQIIIYKR